MPKELITRRPATVDSNETLVKVGWNRKAEYVQVATLAPDDRPLQPTPEGNGWHVDMDRESINRLIRALRRARDQAFGRDE